MVLVNLCPCEEKVNTIHVEPIIIEREEKKELFKPQQIQTICPPCVEDVPIIDVIIKQRQINKIEHEINSIGYFNYITTTRVCG